MAQSLELPLGKRTKKYRLFEMLPGIMSLTVVGMLFVLAWFNTALASMYLLLIILVALARAVVIATHTIRGYRHLMGAQKVDWHRRLLDLEHPADSLAHEERYRSSQFGQATHMRNLRAIVTDPTQYPKPSQLRHAVIVAAYNESIEVIEPTIQSLLATTIDSKQLIIAFAYEQRGGEGIKQTAKTLKERYGDQFGMFYTVEHPKDLPDEVVGKGGNITYAGEFLARELKKKKLNFDDVIVTTLDCDNRPHPVYFDYVSYEYIVHTNRQNLSYQPISLFLNNIWDVPAPMRVIATGNSFWNIISSMKPDQLRNFASHSQPLTALVGMNFWSKRSIVEDGHQFWRSYFYFNGDYAVTPIYAPIYQDAVLSETYKKTLVAQFKQLRRWAYGASDVPYVAVRVFTKKRKVPFGDSLVKFYELLDGHVTLASISILIAFGGWIPLLFSPESARSVPAHQLPVVVSSLQQIALVGLCISIFFSLKMLPPRPARYKRHRTIFMVAQWILMPVTAIAYGAMSALNAQMHLLFGRYLDKFDVTEKATVGEINRVQGHRQHWWQWWKASRDVGSKR
ncbi:glycosyltransferase family 2 protein [Candidatus Saccharibacteria bacterium]|nr:glycosyltransferase family 2 protein [Candidatus Saccharibacteria bacterium]MBH2007901.1 glycosyltransferase family 2 protein [Candidatus Saccharibacteria bacterium]